MHLDTAVFWHLPAETGKNRERQTQDHKKVKTWPCTFRKVALRQVGAGVDSLLPPASP